ncbi:MAG: hypothetical protein BAJALOKI3v1_40081 [Promethearchaeota archaeon]|nr:MAG: hypothetical protein BAJALOKI3v1_40081 [Candidatus Lokiarchaeota archaeon]
MYEDTKRKLEENEGNTISIVGIISSIIWQHMLIHDDRHPEINYIDLENGFQLVVYTDKEINCEDEIEIIGKVIKVKGSKNPRSKLSDEYCEFQLIADSWKCI